METKAKQKYFELNESFTEAYSHPNRTDDSCWCVRTQLFIRIIYGWQLARISFRFFTNIIVIAGAENRII